MKNTTTTLEIGQMLVIDGEIRTIVSLNGRWIKLSDDTNVSRATAIQGRVDYIEDADTLGEELDNPEDHDTQDAQDDADDEAEVHGYTGPMIALRQRLAAGAYSKAANGQPCCGDAIAQALGALKPAQVIRACVIAMNLPANPYTHLNVGQQSMNLRNKLRGCLKRAEFGMGVVNEAVEQVVEDEATV